MNRKRCLLMILIFLCFSSLCIGQDYIITGVVKDSISNESISYANILLLHADSSLYSGTISDTCGYFKLHNLEEGEYIFIISFIGYKTQKSFLSITDSKKSTNLGIIKLLPDFKILDAVEVKGSPKYNNLIDRTVFVPDSSLLANSLTSLDLLNKVSDLAVNKAENSVSIKGHESTLVLINGTAKPGMDLRSINPEDILKVLIITNPTSEYESEIDGVINIILKEKPTKGSSFFVSTDYMPVGKTVEQGLYLQYGTKNIRFNMDYIFSHKNFLNNGLIERQTEGNNVYNEVSKCNNHPETYQGLKFGIDYYLNEKNYFNYSSENSLFFANTESFNQVSIHIDSLEKYKANTILNAKTNYILSNHTIFYKRKFLKEGHEFTINNNFYISNSIYSNNYLDSIFNSSINSNIIRRVNKENALKKSNILKLDYSLPISNTLQFSVGSFIYFQKFHNVFNTSTNGSYNFKNSKYAFYFDVYKKINSWSIRFGGRIESIKNFYEDSVIYNNTKVLPTLVISKTINNKTQFSLSYRKTVYYPSVWQLTPYIVFWDSLNATQGNALLRPTTLENIELLFMKRKQDNLIKIGAFYKIFDDFIGINNYVDNSNFMLRKVENFDKKTSIGMNIVTSHVFFDCFEFETASSFFNENIHNSITGQIRDNYSYSISVSIAYSFLEKYYFWADASFIGKTLSPQGFYKHQNVISAFCIQRDVFKGRGNIGIMYRYPFTRYKTEYNFNEGNVAYRDFTEIDVSGFQFKFSLLLSKGAKVENHQFEKLMESDIK